jgi:hypothetical protein
VPAMATTERQHILMTSANPIDRVNRKSHDV